MTGDRQALSTARFRRVGQLATVDTCLYLLQVILCKKTSSNWITVGHVEPKMSGILIFTLC